MIRLAQEEGRYRVRLVSIGGNTEEEKESFSHNLSQNYTIPFPLIKKIVDRCPFVIKKNLSLEKAEILARILKSFGGMVSVEERINFPTISLEFQELVPYQLALESSYLQKTQRGTWNAVGRVKNISDETLNDPWVLIQLFGDFEEFVSFEESPFPINPLPPGEASPFKVVFEGDHNIKGISVAFKNASGQPIPAVDRRKRKEWAEVEIGEGRYLPASLKQEEKPPAAEEIVDKDEKTGMEAGEKSDSEEKEEIFPAEASGTLETVMEPVSGEDTPKEEQAAKILGKVMEEEDIQLTLPGVEVEMKAGPQESSEGKSEEPPPDETTGKVEEKTQEKEEEKPAEKAAEKVEEKKEETGQIESEVKTGLEGLVPHDGIEKPGIESPAFLEIATQRVEDILKPSKKLRVDIKVEEREGEESEKERMASFPWIEKFIEVVENYYKKPVDGFPSWFEETRKKGDFSTSLHALLTILVHSRFEQGGQTVKALENTKRVFHLIAKLNILLDEIPMLEETPFVSGSVWRELFQRAMTKTRQTGDKVIEKEKWNASDLEKLIQVIPHMSHQNSRMAVQWINELIPDVVTVNFSNSLIIVEEDLYRVSSRLGIVDPYFDSYQGKGSIGDRKIQAFSKAAFQKNPLKVEEPISRMGKNEERGGHCFPVQPRCEGCLFETFCPRLYPHINPSEKGMKK